MAEPTLTLTHDDLYKAVSEYAGWGFKAYASETDATKKARVQEFIDAGYRDLLNAHKWSWLFPTTSIAAWPDLAVGTQEEFGMVL